jgi:hypothetical protein
MGPDLAESGPPTTRTQATSSLNGPAFLSLSMNPIELIFAASTGPALGTFSPNDVA